MTTRLAKTVELDFVEFVSILITDVLEAIVKAMLEQEKRVLQLEQNVTLTPEDFAKKYLIEATRAEVLRLFPHPGDIEGKSSIDPGEPYKPKSEREEESPRIYNNTGYKMVKEDIKEIKGGFVINKRGYDHINNVVMSTLASLQLDCLRKFVSKGVPRVYLDNGHILAKITLKFENTASSEKLKATDVTTLTPMRRLIVQPINTSKPEYLTLKADIISEVEITFKTITS